MKLIRLFFSLVCMAVLFGMRPPGAAAEAANLDQKVYLPAVYGPLISSGAVIVNHLNFDISKIPDRWIEAAKALTVHYAHTSHGSQILTGMAWLENQNSRYRVGVRSTYEGLGLPEDTGAIRFYDGNNVPNNDYITPDLYWSTTAGKNYTRSVVSTGLFRLSTWTWCGQQTTNSAEEVNQYLTTLNQFESEFPQVRFIYFTGHTDGDSSSRLLENNQIVRKFATDNKKILFDFADFEMYDPSGTFYPNATDACPWCQNYCNQHPSMCANLDQMGDCAHTHGLQCKLKAQAFWWLAARVAGWDGVSQ